MADIFNSSSRGILSYTFTASNDSTGASDSLTSHILFGQLNGIRFLNNTNSNDSWDCTVRDENGLSIYASTALSSDNGNAANFVIPSLAGTGASGDFTYPVSGQLSVSIANASASSAPQVVFFLRQ